MKHFIKHFECFSRKTLLYIRTSLFTIFPLKTDSSCLNQCYASSAWDTIIFQAHQHIYKSRYLIVTLPFHFCCYCHPLHPTWLDVRRSLSQSDLYSCCFPCVSLQALPAHYNYFWFLLLKKSKRKHNKHNVIQMSINKIINHTVHQEPTIYWSLNWKHFDLFIWNTCAGNAIDTGPHQKDD